MKMMMKSVMAGAFVSLATVAVPEAANATVCGAAPLTNLMDYENLGAAGCTVGDKNFFDFNYIPGNVVNGGTRPSTAAGVGVLFAGFNVTFTNNWTAPLTPPGDGASSSDSTIEYTVKTIDGAKIITGVDINLFGAATGTGSSASSMENLCIGGLRGPTCPDAIILNASLPGTGMNSTSFAGVSEVDFLKNIFLAGGPNGEASLSAVENSLTQTPEPASLAILAVSLLGMGAAVRVRRFRK